MNSKVILFWLRRDLRFNDNTGLNQALACAKKQGCAVLPIFIFDTNILKSLNNKYDRRVQFVYENIGILKQTLQSFGSDLRVYYGDPEILLPSIVKEWQVKKVFCNHDYEPYARLRDNKIANLCTSRDIEFLTFKDQVIFEKSEVLTGKKQPYTVFTPYKNAWLKKFAENNLYARQDTYINSCSSMPEQSFFRQFLRVSPEPLLSLRAINFASNPNLPWPAKQINKSVIINYLQTRDFPSVEMGTTHLGMHLRFGTISIRELVSFAFSLSSTFISELIWREFFMQILWHFPQVENNCFKAKYEAIAWSGSDSDFARWSSGETGYPLIDAGIRELLSTGHMHNRVRMLVASFLTKNLLINWQRGERFFAAHLLDYELASNVGNWQWACGCGCDAAPYFRIFNPDMQKSKFDPKSEYIKTWVKEFGSSHYPSPMIGLKHSYARAISTYKTALV